MRQQLTCKKCGCFNNMNDDSCWKCKEPITDDDRRAFDDDRRALIEKEEFKVENTAIKTHTFQHQYTSQYATARNVSGFMAFVGWVIILAGAILGVTSLQNGFAAVLASFGVAISGAFIVLGAQVTAATVDNADHTREILNILSRKLSDKEEG